MGLRRPSVNSLGRSEVTLEIKTRIFFASISDNESPNEPVNEFANEFANESANESANAGFGNFRQKKQIRRRRTKK